MTMRANCFQHNRKVSVVDVPEPRILNTHDAIVRVTSTAICGSDLHLYNGFMPTLQKGDVLGHEFMGEVMEVGRSVRNLKVGDREIDPSFVITHTLPLTDAAKGYDMFLHKHDHCEKVVLKAA